MKTNIWICIKRRIRFVTNEIKNFLKGDTRTDFEKNVQKCRILHLPDIIHNPCAPKKQTPEQVDADKKLVRRLVSRISSSDSLHG